MAESSVNNLNGVPFWGHGSEENMMNDVTPSAQLIEGEEEEKFEVLSPEEEETEVEINNPEEE